MSLLILGAALALLYGLVRLLYRRFWERGLDCRLSFQEETAVEDGVAVLREVVDNRKLLPLPVVEAAFHMDRRLRFADGQNTAVSDQTYRRDVFALGARQRVTRRLEIQCVGRGYFRLEQCDLLARDLFLLRKFRTERPQSTELYVLPRAVPAPRVEIPYARIMGAVLSRRKVYDDPFEFAGLREYTRGDPMKYMNWKATARAGKLLTNLHESTLAQRVTVLLDVETLGQPQREQVAEEVVRLAAALCLRLLAAGVELSLHSNGRDARTGALWRLDRVVGTASGMLLRKELACVEKGSGLSPVCGLWDDAAPREEELTVLLTGESREDLAEDFSRLVGRGRGIQVVVGGEARREPAAFPHVERIWLQP